MDSNIQVLPQYSETTNDIKVVAAPFYLTSESIPSENFYVWAYQIRIENNSSETVQVLGRHWVVTDNKGKKHEVKGEGVIGKKPILKPGEVFEYASGTHLFAPSGIMSGIYKLKGEHSENFDIRIPLFSLDSTEQIEHPN